MKVFSGCLGFGDFLSKIGDVIVLAFVLFLLFRFVGIPIQLAGGSVKLRIAGVSEDTTFEGFLNFFECVKIEFPSADTE